MKNSLVVDSSVAVKWYLPENGSERAASLLEAAIRLVAPDLLIPEVGNVLWTRQREMPVGRDGGSSDCPDDSLSCLSVLVECSVYDSLYLALALSEDCPLVTADARFSNALQESGLEEYIQVL